MTAVPDDLITALSESIVVAIKTVTALKSNYTLIYSQSQLDDIAQNTALPHVFFYYVGIQQEGRTHRAMFDLILVAKSQPLTRVNSNTVMPVATAILHDLRKAMACNRPVTHRGWDLQLEVADFGETGHLMYQQRWATNCQIKN